MRSQSTGKVNDRVLVSEFRYPRLAVLILYTYGTTYTRTSPDVEDREANQKDALLNVLASVGLGGFPYLEGDAAASVRLDDVVAAALRLLDVAPFFKVLVVNDKAGFGNAILVSTWSDVSCATVRFSPRLVHTLATFYDRVP